MRLYLIALLSASTIAFCQNFAGASGGVSTLSADATARGSPPAAFSGYKPENGVTMMFFGGRHLSDWWSVQASYGWNRNPVLLSAVALGPPAGAYDVPVRATIHTVVAEAMLYFRRRESRIRPYLAAGPGVSILRSQADGAPFASGAVVPPASEFDSAGACFRVAVGVDIAIRRSLALRYTFSETLQANALGRPLTPQGRRNLANFQNLWGLAWSF